jgi:hypothetical protein
MAVGMDRKYDVYTRFGPAARLEPVSPTEFVIHLTAKRASDEPLEKDLS